MARSAANPALPQILRNFFQDRVDAALLSRYAVPDRVILVGSLEKTSVGKINKRTSRALRGIVVSYSLAAH